MKKWIPKNKVPQPPLGVICKHSDNSIFKEFSSFKEAALYFKVSKQAIHFAVNQNTPCRNFFFSKKEKYKAAAEKACCVCNSVFSRKYFVSDTAWNNQKYCSQKCLYAKDSTIFRNCKKCGVKYGRAPSTVGLYCSRTCSKYARYIEDRNLLKKDERKDKDVRYNEWRRFVKNRDSWKCRISNKDCKGRLEAHHILPWRSHKDLRYEINNGITLCVFHHPRKEVDEIRLSPYFQELVSKETLL